MILATLVLAAVTVAPQRVLIENTATSQSVNFDLIVENPGAAPLDLDEVQVEVRDRAGKLVLRRLVDGNGTRPSIRTVDIAEVPAGGKALLFNPFHTFDRGIELATLTYTLKLSTKDGSQRFIERVTVRPEAYANKSAYILPVAGRLIVYDGHDFLSHHRRWDYTIPGLQALGFRTNFMRYSYDFVPVNDAGEMSSGDEAKNENWFGFGRPVRATADGTVAAVVDDQPDDRKFDPSSIAQHGTMRVWGNYVVIDHGHGEFGLYGHIRQGSARVRAGQRVKRGATIAAIGASGSSMFPHLHYELQTGIDTNVEGLPSTFTDFVRVQGSRRVEVKAGGVDSGEIVEDGRAVVARTDQDLAPVVQFLLTAAATDFHTHRPPDPVRFRDVRLGYVMTDDGEKQYMLCGQFLPAQGGASAEWVPFATIRTDPYEQWTGTQAAGLCQGSSVTWEKEGDLSRSLQSRLDSLQ